MSNYSSNFPTQRPSLNLVFNGGSDQLDSRISFSRADTPPTYAAPSAVHYWSNEKHLSSENLVPYSNLSSGFSFGRTTLASTNNSAPDGGSDAASILETAVNGSHEVFKSFICVSGQQYSFVFYLKANGRTKALFRPQLTSVVADVEFDLTAVTSTVIAGSADSHSITAIGSTGWYKCHVTATATATGTGYTQFNLLDAGGNITYTGDVTKGMYAWGSSASSTGETVLNETSGSIHRSFASTLKSVTTSGQPRFEYSPTDGQSVGLLIEAQSSNLFARSSGFDYTSAWTKTNVTASAEAISPDGTLNAFAIRESASGGTKRIHQAATVSAGSVAVSVYAKILGNERRLVIREDSATGDSAVFDLSSGTVAATNVGGAGTIESVGNDWYRCTLITSPGSGSQAFGFWLATATGTNYESYTGDGYSGVLLFGAMCENASAPSSYLESLGSTTTRAADSCSVAVSDFAGFADTEGSVIVEATVNSLDSGNAAAVSLANAAGTEYIKTGYEIGGATDQSVRTYVRSNSLDQAWLDAGSVSTTGSYKVGVRYEKNNVGISLNGASAVTDTVATMPIGMTTLYIGSGNSSGGNPLNANLKRIAYYSEPLSDANLTALTS